MSNEVLYEKKTFLLAIQGTVTVHLLDGQMVEGEFTTQDDLHIFLLVDAAPVMIPRQQIRFIKGRPGQPIAAEGSSNGGVQKELNRQRESTAPSEVTPRLEVQRRIREESDTRTQATAFERFATQTDEYEGTLILETPSSHNMEESGGTMVLSENEVPAWEQGSAKNYEATMILENNADKTPNPFAQDDGQATFILEEPLKPKVQPMLVCINGPHMGQSFVVTDSMMLGRASTNEVALVNDKEISRRHATVTREGDHYILQDQNSLNGTFVNDHPIMGQYYLQHGDVILVGVSHLEFRSA